MSSLAFSLFFFFFFLAQKKPFQLNEENYIPGCNTWRGFKSLQFLLFFFPSVSGADFFCVVYLWQILQWIFCLLGRFWRYLVKDKAYWLSASSVIIAESWGAEAIWLELKIVYRACKYLASSVYPHSWSWPVLEIKKDVISLH